MNPDFIPVRDLEGHLLLSIKKSDYGVTVSTTELVYHKPHVNYYLRLKDMISITPFSAPKPKRTSFSVYQDQTAEYEVSFYDGQSYRIHVSSAIMHNRSGRIQMGEMQFVLPIPARMLQLIGQHSGMNPI